MTKCDLLSKFEREKRHNYFKDNTFYIRCPYCGLKLKEGK